MVYTNNVPQANQQIAATQPIIQANFDYIQKAVGQEHNFVANDTDPTHTYHLQASMPNKADPGGLPAGTNGQYYVSGGLPKFYNTSGAAFFTFGAANFQYLTGSNSVNSGAAFTILSPGNYMGLVSAFQNGSPNRYQLIQFYMNGGSLVANNPLASGGTGNITLQLSAGSLQILNGSGSPQTIKWQVFYTAAP